jgi:branched-chain amino acid transport system substrate-binding protein
MRRNHPSDFPTRSASRLFGVRTRLLLATAFVALSGCAPDPPGEIRIGLLGVFEGSLRENSGRPAERGATLAVEEINAEGGLQIEGVTYDLRLVSKAYQPRRDAATTVASRLINIDSVHVLVGPQLSSQAIPVAILANSSGVPMVSPMSSNPETTLDKPYVFRMAALDDFQGGAMARFAVQELQAGTAAILFNEAEPYSRDLARRFADVFEELGGRISITEAYTSDQAQNVSGQLQRISATSPDVFYLPNASSDALFQMPAARRAGIEAVFLGSDNWDLTALQTFPVAVRAYATHQWHFAIPEERALAFRTRFQTRFGRRPRTTAAMTYDAVRLLAAVVMREQSLDGTTIATGIAGTREFRGVTGTFEFAPGGNPRRSIVVSQVWPDSIRVVRVVDP